MPTKKVLGDRTHLGRLGTQLATPPPDADVATGEAVFYIDTTAGAPKVRAKIKDNAGTPQILDLGGGAAAVSKYSVDIGGAADIVVTHNLNTRDVQVSVHRNSTPWDTILVDVERTTLNSVTIRFPSAVAADAFRCVVVG